MKYKSLRFRTIASFCILSIALLAVNSIAIEGATSMTEDRVFGHIIKREAANYFERYKADPNTYLPLLADLKVYVDLVSMPPEFKRTVQGLEDGVYETSGPGSIPGIIGYNILVETFPGEEKKLYLFYNTDQVIYDYKDYADISDLHILIFIAIALFGIILSCIIGSIIFKPLRSLTDRVREAGPDNIIQDFPEAEREDEIGLLAQNISHSFQRIQAFIKREQQFTQSASHELRTPLSVIKGATDLIPIALSGNTQAIDKLLGRISRSTKNMEDTISTFLWLAREDNLSETGGQCDVTDAIDKVVKDLHPLLEQKQVKLHVLHDEQMVISAPKQVVRIVLSNILSNAITYTSTGSISILAEHNKITIVDTGTGIPEAIIQDVTQPHVRGENSNGFGLGLSIVKSLCDRFSWRLSIQNRQSVGTVVFIEFPNEA